MSTKTTFKRIALVAAASLGLGVLSVVPSQAAVSDIVFTATNGAATLQNGDSTTAASLKIVGTVDATDSITLSALLVSAPSTTYKALWYNFDSSTPTRTNEVVETITTSLAANAATGYSGNLRAARLTGGGFNSGDLNGDTALAVGSSGTARNLRISTAGSAYVNRTIGLGLDSATARVAGTYTFRVVVKVYNTGTANNMLGTGPVVDATYSRDLSIVVTDATTAATTGTTAAGTSSAIMYQGSAFGATNIDSTVVVANTPSSSTASAVIRVTQLTAAGVANRESVTVTTNIGNVGDCSSIIGKSIKLLADVSGVNDVCVYADGTSGVATINVSTTSVTFAPKTVTFYSTTVAKIAAGLLGKTVGSSAAYVILAKAFDAQGVQITGNSSVYAYSSDLTVVNTGTSTGTECTYIAAYSGHVCSLSGAANGTATITLRNKSTAALSTVTSTDVLSLTVNSNTPVAIKLAFDKASYAPGEVAYIRGWAVDAAGTPVAPGVKTNLFATGGITSTVAFGNGSDTTTSVSPTFGYTTASGNGYASTDPIVLYKVYMPYVGGTVSISATGGTLLPTAGQVAVTATATVTDNGAQALAAVTALASQVSAFITKINAQITTLTDLVMKIQKKVKA